MAADHGAQFNFCTLITKQHDIATVLAVFAIGMVIDIEEFKIANWDRFSA